MILSTIYEYRISEQPSRLSGGSQEFSESGYPFHLSRNSGAPLFSVCVRGDKQRNYLEQTQCTVIVDVEVAT